MSSTETHVSSTAVVVPCDRHAVVASVVAIPSYGGGSRALSREANEAAKASLGLPHVDPVGTPPHNHNDPATKNAVSRAGAVRQATQDPTTATERRANASYVARERALPDPRLTTVAAYQPRAQHPQTRYAMANGCYSLERRRHSLRPVHVQAHRPRHLPALQRRQEVPRGQPRSRAATPARAPTRSGRCSKAGSGFTFTLPGGRNLSVSGKKLAIGGQPARLRAVGRQGLRGVPRGRGRHQRRPARRRLAVPGGARLRRRPHPRHGVRVPRRRSALRPAVAQVRRAVRPARLPGPRAHRGLRRDPRDVLLRRAQPRPGRLADVQGLAGPELADPRGHLLAVARALLARRAAAVRQPAGREQQALRDLPAEAQLVRRHGLHPAAGPRHVPDPGLHRRPVRRSRQGLLPDRQDAVAGPQGDQRRQDGRGHGHRDQRAVRLHVQGDARHRRTRRAPRPTSTASSTEMHRLGVRQMELVNKFDNALAGVAGDNGATGAVVNAANFLETGTFWDMRHCTPADGESSDHTQLALPGIGAEQQDALFGAIGKLFGGVLPALPLYGRPLHCNRRGLTSLGANTIRGLAKRDMIFDPDHLSVKARQAAMDLIEKLDYPGVISSHSWSTPDAYPRIYKAGGFITPYAGDSTGFVDKWRRHLGWADTRYYFGFGYGADINGLGAQGNPRGAGVPNKVTYPFTGLNGVMVERQVRRQARLRHQQRRRRAVRPLPRLDPGPPQGGRPRRRQDRRRHGPRRRGLPADVGARRRHRARLLPQPAACARPCAKVQSLLRPGMTTTAGDEEGRPAVHAGSARRSASARSAVGDKVMVDLGVHAGRAGWPDAAGALLTRSYLSVGSSHASRGPGGAALALGSAHRLADWEWRSGSCGFWLSVSWANVVALAITGRRVVFLFRLITSGQPAPDRIVGVTKRLGRAVAHPADRGLRPEEAAQVVDPRRRALLRVLGVPDPGHGLPRGLRHPALPQRALGDPDRRPLGPARASPRTSSRVMACSASARSPLIRLKERPGRLGRKSRFKGSHLGGAWLVLFMIFNVIWTMFLFRGAAAAAEQPALRQRRVRLDGARQPLDGLPRRPRGARGRRPAAAHRHHAGVPGRRACNSKHLHIFLAPLNVLFSRRPGRAGRGQAADERRQAGHPRRHRRPRRGRQARHRLDRGLQLEGHARLHDLHRVRPLPVAVPGVEHREAAVAEDADHERCATTRLRRRRTCWPAEGTARRCRERRWPKPSGRSSARPRATPGTRRAAPSSTPTCCGPA